MTTHYIILSSSYSHGDRICLDYVDDIYCASKDIVKIQTVCGEDVAISFYSVITRGEDWNSVRFADKFFDGVRKIDNVDEFINEINNDRQSTALDLARYILSKVGQCTHLKLQKLLYFCYADYLCATGEKLFEDDKICAITYGPVVSNICDMLKGTYGNLTQEDLFDEEDKYLPEFTYLPARSRIMFTRNGNRKLMSIDRTLSIYGDMNQYELVNLTHRDNSPWAVTKSRNGHRIYDEVIKNYHKFETI